MSLTGDGDYIVGTDTPHTAWRDGGHWRVSWLPGRHLTNTEATTAIVVASAVARNEPADSDIWVHIAGWAAELGLGRDEAATMCRRAPGRGRPMADDGVRALREDLTRSLLGGPWGEAAAVAVLLDFEPIAADPRFARHVNRSGVDWRALTDDVTWSPLERFLIATAAGLWGGRAYGADVSRVPFLSDDFYTAWQAMVTASRTGKVPTDAGT